jgi:DNA replication protein DnaC
VNPAADPSAPLLGRLRLTALRDRLDTLLDEAARRDLNLREALTFFCQAEVARREQRRLEMAARLAKFPFVRTLEDFDFAAQPALDPKHFRDLALCRWVANGDGVLLLGPPEDAT